MKTKLIVFMMMALIGSLQASENKQTMQFIPYQTAQQANLKSNLSKQLHAYNKDIRNDGYQMAALCRNSRISEDQVFQVVEQSRLSPNFGVAAQFCKGVSDNCRMSSPTYIALQDKHNAQGVSDEQRKRCKRIMHAILNK